MQNAHSGRGVTIPRSQLSTGSGTPENVVHLMPAQLYACQYADERGNVQNEVFLITGGNVYLLPDGLRWTASLRQAPKWLALQVLGKQAEQTATVPTTDSVDVIDDSVSDVIG